MRAAYLIALTGLIVGCAETSAPGPATIYVDGKAPLALADGSRERPFPSIGQALAVAKPGDSIEVMPGRYPESVWIQIAPLTLRRVVQQGSVERVVVTPPVGQPGVMINDPGGGVPEKVAISNIDVSGAFIAGIWIRSGMVEIENCHVEQTKKVMGNDFPEPVFGFGVLMLDGAHVTIRGGEIRGNEGQGILGVRSNVDIAESIVANNLDEGIRLEGCTDSELRGNQILNNAGAGIAILSSAVTIRENTVSKTERFKNEYGDGIVVADLESSGDPPPPWTVLVSDNTVSGNGRVGILLGAGAAGEVHGNKVEENANGGIWIQDPPGGTEENTLTVSENDLTRNRFVSIHLTGGTRATITGNHIQETRTGIEIADDGSTTWINHGLSVFRDSYASIEENTFGPLVIHPEDPETLKSSHLLIQGAAKGTVVRGNRAEGGASLLIAIQHQEDSKPLDPPAIEDIRQANSGAEVVVVEMDEPIEFYSSAEMGNGIPFPSFSTPVVAEPR